MNKLLKIISKYRINILVITISFSACIIAFYMFCSCTTYRSILYFNWDIITPKYQEIDEVFLYDFRFGQDFVIMKYDKIDKLINYDDYKVILNNNVNEIKKKINRYYDMLDEKEKEMFDKKVDIKYLLKKGNYFLYKNESTCLKEEYILIIVGKNNDVYIMSTREPESALSNLCITNHYWDINFPNSRLSIDKVFPYDDNFKGQSFRIYHLHDDKKEIIEKMSLVQVTEDNQKEVRRKIEDYYNHLSKKKKNKFDNKITLEDLYNTDNYYLYVEQKHDKRDYIITILLPNNKLYALANIECDLDNLEEDY